MAQTPKFESWYDKVAKMMVRQGVTMAVALCELDIGDLTSVEAKRIENTDKFQKTLWAARHQFYSDIANDPLRGKNAAIGQLVCIINRMLERDQLKEAAEAILKLGKLQGWVGEAQTINVFGNLNDRELREIEKKALEAERTSRTRPTDSSESLQ